jgi:recombination protein RecT
VFAAVLTASQFGWEINVHAYLIPYDNRKTGQTFCQLVPAWRGLADLASRSGRASVWTGAVFEGDEFAWALGTKPFIRHRPAGEQTEAKLTHVYAVGWTTGATWPVIEVWPIDKVRKHRDRYNKIGKDHYSYEHLEMYGRKVALLQVLKYMPQSVELQSAVTLEHDAESGEQHLRRLTAEPQPINAEHWIEEEPKSTTEAVKDRLKAKDKVLTEAEQADIWPKGEPA